MQEMTNHFGEPDSKEALSNILKKLISKIRIYHGEIFLREMVFYKNLDGLNEDLNKKSRIDEERDSGFNETKSKFNNNQKSYGP